MPIGSVIHRLQPFIRAVPARNLNCQMGKPAIRCGSMPMLYARRNIHHITGVKLLGFLSPLLIVSPSAYTYQNLPAAGGCMMNMPVIPASRLKGNIENSHLLCGKGSQVALPDKILGKPVIWLSFSKNISFINLFMLKSEEISMDITQLQYFKIIAETGSLTKAVQILHVSQPAMSAMLKKYPQIGRHFLTQIENIIKQNSLPITLVKNEYNITQHLIRTTNFLATISTLSRDLRNDGPNRTLIPLSDPELQVMYYISFLKTGREKVKKFLEWCSLFI